MTSTLRPRFWSLKCVVPSYIISGWVSTLVFQYRWWLIHLGTIYYKEGTTKPRRSCLIYLLIYCRGPGLGKALLRWIPLCSRVLRSWEVLSMLQAPSFIGRLESPVLWQATIYCRSTNKYILYNTLFLRALYFPANSRIVRIHENKVIVKIKRCS